MTKYGGLGGVEGGRLVDVDDLFEVLIGELFGDRIRSSFSFSTETWSGLTNVTWRHTSGDTAGYSFRRAGDVIAAIRGEGDYLDWYCCAPAGRVSDEISEALKVRGWTWEMVP
ncbi:MAG: hypothetical protein E5Y01_16040 [Mesorhizobium sp.]|uniref:hypothetical protein n=1 Tax=Mesorhizobium sp. TaxID=1871066 RepID=UPI001210CA5C|nr:hypothetical protein [Mesorhizobium sp.]TJV51098.1 MAG: hypothetical protein E5Y01_16040 [Mesorhizobium sp.]